MHYQKEKEADIPVALVAFFDDSFNANLHRFDWALASVLLKDNAALGCATFTEKKIVFFYSIGTMNNLSIRGNKVYRKTAACRLT